MDENLNKENQSGISSSLKDKIASLKNSSNNLSNPKTSKPSKNPNDKKSKKKRLVILLLLLVLVVGAGVAIALIAVNSSRNEVEFRLRNVNAMVYAECKIIDENNAEKPVLINGKESVSMDFRAEDRKHDETVSRMLNYDQVTELNSGEIIKFFYIIENRSSSAGMYVDFGKQNTTDYNFKIEVKYHIGANPEETLLTYYAGFVKAENKSYYYESEEAMNNNIGGVENLAFDQSIFLQKNTVMNISVELSIIDEDKDASFNCNHMFELINENVYSR